MIYFLIALSTLLLLISVTDFFSFDSNSYFQLERSSLFFSLAAFFSALLLPFAYPSLYSGILTNLAQALMVFSSVYFAFWLTQVAEKSKEKRRLRFFLGMIWEELRFNRHYLELLQGNWSFYFDDPRLLEPQIQKIASMKSIIGTLKKSHFDALVSSGYIIHIDKDEVFNQLQTVYSNIDHLQSSIIPVFDSILFNFECINKFKLQGKQLKYAIDQMKEKATQLGEEVAISYRTTVQAIDSVDKDLVRRGVTMSEEQLRLSILTAEDQDFLNKVIRNKPAESPF